jgi:hypothetical protein
LAALPLAWAVHAAFGLTGFVAAAVIVFFVGWWATAQHTSGGDDHDPSEIVVDEVIGQWIALMPVFIGADTHGGEHFGTLARLDHRLYRISLIRHHKNWSLLGGPTAVAMHWALCWMM